LNEKGVRDDCSKSAQSRDKPELPEFFAQIEIKFDSVEMFLPVKHRQVAFDWQLERPEPD
jgi:hypothetical protein